MLFRSGAGKEGIDYLFPERTRDARLLAAHFYGITKKEKDKVVDDEERSSPYG